MTATITVLSVYPLKTTVPQELFSAPLSNTLTPTPKREQAKRDDFVRDSFT